MTERNGIRIFIANGPYMYPKAWIETTNGPAPFAFADQYLMIRTVGHCEVLKYGGEPAVQRSWERWTAKPKDFINDCWEHTTSYEMLRDRHGLPR